MIPHDFGMHRAGVFLLLLMLMLLIVIVTLPAMRAIERLRLYLRDPCERERVNIG